MGGEMGTNAGEFLGSRRVSPSMVSSFEPLGRSSVVVPTRVSSDAHRRPPRRVVPSPAPRVTPQDPPRGQHEAFSGAELAERGHAVLRARRDEPAARRRERGDVGAVKLDEGEGDARQGIGILRGGRRVVAVAGRTRVVAGGLVGFGGIGGFVGAGASPSGRVRVGRVCARIATRAARAPALPPRESVASAPRRRASAFASRATHPAHARVGAAVRAGWRARGARAAGGAATAAAIVDDETRDGDECARGRRAVPEGTVAARERNASRDTRVWRYTSSPSSRCVDAFRPSFSSPSAASHSPRSPVGQIRAPNSRLTSASGARQTRWSRAAGAEGSRAPPGATRSSARTMSPGDAAPPRSSPRPR